MASVRIWSHCRRTRRSTRTSPARRARPTRPAEPAAGNPAPATRRTVRQPHRTAVSVRPSRPAASCSTVRAGAYSVSTITGAPRGLRTMRSGIPPPLTARCCSAVNCDCQRGFFVRSTRANASLNDLSLFVAMLVGGRRHIWDRPPRYYPPVTGGAPSRSGVCPRAPLIRHCVSCYFRPMSDRSRIEWTDATWNPIRGCSKVSSGCAHCYAQTFAERFRGVAGHPFEQGFDLRLVPEKLDQPLSWRRPRRIFVNSMSDLFHEAVPAAYIAAVGRVMRNADRHTFQVLTKRHERMRRLLNGELRWMGGPPHVWLGVSSREPATRTDAHSTNCRSIARRACASSPCEPLLGGSRLGRPRPASTG